jgi:hypothetical protein
MISDGYGHPTRGHRLTALDSLPGNLLSAIRAGAMPWGKKG